VPAFQAVLHSTVPLSAGMSSSAAFEMAVALALGRLANLELPWLEWARIGQACENQYVGARTGLLDQFSSLRGKAGHLVYSDFRSLAVEAIPLPAGTALVVANSMVKHQLTNEYNERRAACEQAVAALQAECPTVHALRDVNRAQLEAARARLDQVVFRRALHVVGENERVVAGIAALRTGDVPAFGRLMLESHDSSRLHFENSAPELDILVESGRALPGFCGARLSGGGFGGITVHLVHEAEAADYARRLATAYASRTGRQADTMICHAADGASLLD
jgi:galactokinase